MAEKNLGSASELNIDNFFAPDSGVTEEVEEETESKDTVDEESGEDDSLDTSEESPDQDEDEEEPDDDEEDADEDVDDTELSADSKALKKKAEHAERMRRETQAKYDTLLAKFNQNMDRFEKLEDKIHDIETKTEQSDVDGIFTGDDDSVLTEGQAKKILNAAQQRANKATTKDRGEPAVGTDVEAMQMWANSQPDVKDILAYDSENPTDPDVMTMQTLEGKYMQARDKIRQKQMRKQKSEIKRLKKLIKSMGKGPTPRTGSGGRNAASSGKSTKGDALDRFFSNV